MISKEKTKKEEEEKDRLAMIANWEKVVLENSAFAKFIEERVDGDRGYQERDYYLGAKTMLSNMVPFTKQISYEEKITIGTMAEYIEWQLERI